MADRAYLERLSRELTDKGMLIEAGWVSFRLAAVPPSASAQQLDQMRSCFFAGAQHLFGSIMTIIDPGVDPTAADERRLTMISDELDGFIKAWAEKNLRTEGSA